MARTASSAISSLVAATTATSSRAHCISVPTPWMTRTALTPGRACATVTSSFVTLACAWGQRSTLAKSMPGRLTS